MSPVRFDPPPGLEGVLAIPPDPVPTAEARAALPDEVPMADAVHNVAHASLLVLGLAQRRLLADRPRPLGPAAPGPPRLALPAFDGAGRPGRRSSAPSAPRSPAPGPAVLFWSHWEQTGNLQAALKREAPDCEVQRVMFAPGGADVKEIE